MTRLAIALAMLLPCSLFAQRKASDPAGDWIGSLSIQTMKLRIVFHLSMKGDAWTATMDSPDQGAKGIPIPSVRVEGDSVLLGLPAINGQFRGRLQNDTAIDGNWSQGGMSLPLALARMNVPLEIKRPQEPKRPYPYDDEDVTFENDDAGIRLAGTLTLPRGGRPCAAVVMITGSGPQDRDETIFNHRPFWIIADHLTRQGIAVLRVDDRGIGKSTGKFATATSEDFAGDALAAVRYLRSRSEIDPKRIGLAGHSEGGLIAPMVAQRDKRIAFLVLLAGPGVPGDEILFEQGALIARAAGSSEEIIRKNQTLQKELFAVVREEADSAKAFNRLLEVMRTSVASEKDLDSATRQTAEASIAGQAYQVNSAWFRFFLSYDPRPALRKTTIPVLALNGENDLQVAPTQNLPEIERALKAAGNTHFETKLLPKLNHLFQTCATGAMSEYGTVEETVSPVALQAMGEWIARVTQTK
jgi:pimeloyl-ACP methyl ester carboxylesterase